MYRTAYRKPDYDYSSAGYYFVTICTHQKKQILGQVIKGEFCCSAAGRIVEQEWQFTAKVRPNVFLDALIIMPNHLHGIIVLDAEETNVLRPTLGNIIAHFKSKATKRIVAETTIGAEKIWQRNYYDHIIRNERSLNIIRLYIKTNPLLWSFDLHNPASMNMLIDDEQLKSNLQLKEDAELELVKNYIDYRLAKRASRRLAPTR